MILTISGRKKQLSRHQQEAGIVSIIVATLLIIIVSLIVIAFAQVSRREQRESLDAQLSAQAYYAADTGVNAAKAVIAATADPSTLPAKTLCGSNNSGIGFNFDYDLDATNNIALTCLRVDPNPPNLTYSLDTTDAQVVPILPAVGQTVNTLTFTWGKQKGLEATSTTGCQSTQDGSGVWSIPPLDTWNTGWNCPYGLIRADLVNVSAGLTRSTLLGNDDVSFMMPTRVGSGSTNNTTAISGAACYDVYLPDPTRNNTCRLTFTGLAAAKMYLRLSSVYRSTDVTITGTDQANNPLVFTNAQAKIDATGRAQDVLRRILVSAPLSGGSSAAPLQALISGDSVCKKFGVFDRYYHDFAADNPAYNCILAP